MSPYDPMSGYPLNWMPLTGYIFWRMQSGDSREQALERAKLRPGFPRLTDETWDQIAQAAYLEYTGAQTARAWEESRPAEQLGLAFGRGAVPPGGFGVRVFVTVLLAGGMEKEASVLADCSGGCSINDVFDFARTWIAENARAIWGSQYDVQEILELHVAQLSLVPWGNAAFTVQG